MTRTESVQITADALVSLRVGSPLAKTLGIDGPYDHLFNTEAGRALANMALSLDPVYEQYNIVRYKRFSERMAEAAAHFDQCLVLGTGCDTRAMTLPALATGKCRVYEVDLPDKVAEKKSVLAQNGIAVPDYLHFVPMDLNEPDRATPLTAAGYRAGQPTAVFMEGVSFFLSSDTSAALADPATLGLARSSRLMLDCWSHGRVCALNAKVVEMTGKRLFGDAPFGATAADIETVFRQHGYRIENIQSLGQISDDYGVNDIVDPLGESWFVVETSLD